MSCRFSMRTPGPERTSSRPACFLIAALLGGALSSSAGAQSTSDDALGQRAREILTAHCAPCREVGTLSVPTSAPRPLDLAAIARDPSLIRPGNPDGSPAYAAMMRRLALPGSQPAPDLESLATLRTWIESLPASAATCPQASRPTRRHISPLLIRQAALVRKPISALRVLTLAHLDADCLSAEHLAGWRDALGLFLAALAGSSKPVPMLPLDQKSHHLAVDIQALGWDRELWRFLAGNSTGASRPIEPLIVRADWLVVHVLRGGLGARFVSPSEPPTKPRSVYDPDITPEDRAIVQAMFAGVARPESLARNVESILQLARAHLAPAGLSRVAAELGIERTPLERAIAKAPDDARNLLLRLAYGTVPRAEIEISWPMLGRLASAPPPATTSAPSDPNPPGMTREVDLSTHADRTRYAAGDPVHFTIRSNVECHLTVISIDASGYGTVIFPNDFAARDLLNAELDLVLPAPGARYRFRVKQKGRERVVALCARTPGIIEGIEHDFERQRFQELGPYAAHLDAALKSALERHATVAEHASSARGRLPSAQHVPLHLIWRTGIILDVN
jgi:hypothetical protein